MSLYSDNSSGSDIRISDSLKQQYINQLSSDEKLTIRLRPIGSTASINPKIFKILRNLSITVLTKFLCKKLMVSTVYVYVSNLFLPNPDENIGELFDNFGVNGELIINYCNSVAFG